MKTDSIIIPDFNFSLGGYFAGCVLIHARKGVIRSIFSPDQLFMPDNLFDDKDQFFKTLLEENIIDEIIPSEKDWSDFLEALKITDKWKRNYVSPICDGIQWSLDVYFKLPEGKRKLNRVYGSNKYPADFDIFAKALAKLIQFSKLKNKHKF